MGNNKTTRVTVHDEVLPAALCMGNNKMTRVTVHDEVLPAALCQELAVEIKDSAGADPHAHEVSLVLPVPSSVYQKILSIVDGDQQGGLLVSMEAMLVPARVSAQGVPLHQVGSSCWLASLNPFRLTPPRASPFPLSTLARCCRTNGILLESQLQHLREKTVMEASAGR